MFAKVSVLRTFDVLLLIALLVAVAMPTMTSTASGLAPKQPLQDAAPTDTPVPTETPIPSATSIPPETTVPGAAPDPIEPPMEAAAITTTHCGTISSSQVWSSGANVHTITCDVTVAAGAILTISEGAIVKFELGTSLRVQGTLRVLGTAMNPVYLTSIRDDSIGGDTNGDGSSTSAAPGNWSRIEFQDSSDDVNSLIDNAVIRYGGNSSYGGVTLLCASPTIQNTQLANNQYYAIRADLCSFPTLNVITYTNNGINGLAIQGGTITGNVTWNMTSAAYFIIDDVTVGAGVTLTINPGVVVKFENNRSLLVQGALRAMGTSGSKIYFTSRHDDTVKGDTNNNGSSTSPTAVDWGRIEFQDSSIDATSLIDNTIIRYGGNNSYGGITLLCASPTIQNTQLANNQFYAIRADLCSFPTLSLISYLDNGINGLALQGGTITSNTTWSMTDAAYFIIDNVTVGPAVILTINPSVVIKFENNRSLLVQGALHAVGTSVSKIYFTSRHDDSVKGDTNNNGSSTSPTAGNWGSIQFEDSSIDAMSLIDNTVISYGGGSSNGGINLISASPTIQNTQFASNQYYAIRANVASSPLLINNTYTNNGINGLAIQGGTITSNTLWDMTDTAYFITDNITVGSGATLTVYPGVVVKFDNDRSLLVQGALRALGTPGVKVYFTSRHDDTLKGDTNNNGTSTSPTAGNWHSIEFQDSSVDATSLIDNAVIRYGGGCCTYGGINLLSASPTIQNTQLTNNQYYAIRADLASFPTLSLNTYTNNGINGLALQGGTIASNATWNMTDTAYFITNNITIGTGVTLTVNPGVVVKFENNRSLFVQGALRAVGTSGSKVYFTSRHDDTAKGDTNNDGSGTSPTPGNWGSIEFQDSSDDVLSLIDYSVIRYGGGCCTYAGVNLVNAAPTIQNSTISNNQYYGISTSHSTSTIFNTRISNNSYGLYLDNSTPTIGNSLISNNSVGIYASNSLPNLNCNNIYSNSSYGLFNATSGVMVDARNQWWGGSSGPYHPTTNGSGLGNAVSDDIQFAPWLALPCGAPPPPPDFKKIEPLNGAIKQSTSPTLKWETNIDATGYEYCYDQSNNDTCDTSWIPISATSVALSGLGNNTSYYWQVRAINAGGTTLANMGAWWTFRVVIAPPTLISPVQGDFVSTLRPTFDWGDVAGATGYTIQISTSNTFATLAHTASPVSSNYTPATNLPKGRLYWRVRSTGTNGPSNWSEVRYFQSPYPPAAPTLKLPANNFLSTDYTPLFMWNPISIPLDAPSFDKYQLQVATDSAFNTIVIDTFIVGVANTQYTPPTDLATNTKYFWRVRGIDALPENGAWSAVWNFRTALTPPTLISPANLSDVQSLRPGFDWGDVSGSGLVSGYTIQISKNDTFTQIVNTGNPIPSSYIPTIDLPKNLTLYWRVQTRGANGPSAWSEVRSFNSANSPTTPILSLPAAGALVTSYTPLFKWSAVTLPAPTTFKYYQLQVDDSSDFSSPVIDDSSITDRLIVQYQVVAPLAHNTRFYWRVRAVNTDDEVSNWSAMRYFRTIVDAPALLSPQDGYESLTLRPFFDWMDVSGSGITGYTVQISKNSTFTQIAHSGSTVTSSYVPAVDLPRNMTLYWRVQTKGANGPSAWSGFRSFISANSPTTPALIQPALNTLNTDYLPLFVWSAVTVPAPSSFKYYQLQVDDNIDFSSPVINNTSITNPLITQFQVVIPLTHNTKFYWRVRAVNTDNEVGNWSTVWYFRTIIDAPALMTPLDGATGVSLKPLLDWNDVAGNAGYTLQLWKAGTTPVLVKAVILTPNVSEYQFILPLLPNTSYFWKVQTRATNGPSAWSDIFDFTTGP